ncbi:MAG: FAD-dependent oxidoreductase [Verrucomicrobiota bacterium]
MPPEKTSVCIAGGGPAGMVLGYLLGRCGIATLILESQKDFDRDFRGDTLHAGVMEVFDALGLADRILELPHEKIRKVGIGNVNLVDFRWLKTKFPFVTMMAQSMFLDFLAEEARSFPTFRLAMGASVRELMRNETGRVIGLRYRQAGGMHEIAAPLVVACDGRGSRLRKEAGLVPDKMTDLLEVLWFRLLREPSDSFASGALPGGRLPFILLERPDHYQIAAVIPPGRYQEIRAEGLEAFHERLREAAPELFSRAQRELDDWKKVAFLHVEGSRLKTWHQPGLLLIGDAAHVMTPVGGVGINYAIWDAVEAANVLVPVLRSGKIITEDHLAEIQRRREGPTRMMQAVQRLAGRRVLNAVADDESRRLEVPAALRILTRLPGIRSLMPRLIALGWKRTRCDLTFDRLEV